MVTITITTKRALDMIPAMSVLANEKWIKAGSLSYRLAKIAKKLFAIRDEFQAEQRKMQIEKYAELDDKGNFIFDGPMTPQGQDFKYKDKAGYDKAVEEMGKVEEELTFTPITVDEVEQATGHAPNPATICDLWEIFMDPEEEVQKKPDLKAVN